MKMRNIRQNGSYLCALGFSVSMAFVACSSDDTVTQGNSGGGSAGTAGTGSTAATAGTTGTTTAVVASCGTLDAAEASQLATTRLEHVGTVGLAALSGLENSRAAARLLSAGDGTILDPFVTDSQTSLHDFVVELRDKHLIAANVESTTDATVTFLLRPETLCQDDSTSPTNVTTGGAAGTGGTTGTTTTVIDAECVKKYTENPARIRISRIACDAGNNVAVEYLYGPNSQRLILAELYAERADLEVDLGVYLPMITSTTTASSSSGSGGTYTTTEETVTEPFVSSAVGKLSFGLTLTGTDQATGKLSVTEAIDVTLADDSAARLRLAAGTDIATITANGTAKTIKVVANVGAFDWRTPFEDFIQNFFGLSTSTTATTQAPVDLHLAGLHGSVSLDGATDVIIAEGLDLGAAPATATQGTVTLLSVTTTNAESGALAATLSGNADNSLGIAFPDGLAVGIKYGLEPVIAAVQDPANFLSDDTITITTTSGSTLTLLPDADDNLAVTSSQTGTLLRVDAGTLALSSDIWPSDTVTVGSSQCMSRTVATSTDHNDLLDDLVGGACTY